MLRARFKKYFPAAQDGAKYFTSFCVLHELTAIIPIPFAYAGLTTLMDSEHLPPWLTERMKPSSGDGKYMSHDVAYKIAATYAIVKMLLPVRLAVSAMLTPWFTRRVTEPLTIKFGKYYRAGKN